MRSALGRMTKFYQETTHWRVEKNHNHLRITRMIKSLRLVGLESEAQAFYLTMKDVEAVSAKSKGCWAKAAATSLR